eukprot:gene4247-7584_t
MKTTISLNDSAASDAIKLFTTYHDLDVQINSTDGDSFVETTDGTFKGPLTICHVISSLASNDSFISRDDDFQNCLISQYMSMCLQTKDISTLLTFLNAEIEKSTYFVGTSLSFADFFIFSFLSKNIEIFDKVEYVSLCRWFDFIQNLKQFPNLKKQKLSFKTKEYQFVKIPEMTQKKKPKKEGGEKEGGKKKVEKKVEKKVVFLADIRVGKILSVKKHEEADTLYVEEIDVGEEKPRTICSGLVNHLKPEDLQDKLVLVFCNLKPKNARGILSAGMVLCATDSVSKKVELVKVPEGSKPGELVQFGGENLTPDKQLHDRKLKPILADLKTNSDGIVM